MSKINFQNNQLIVSLEREIKSYEKVLIALSGGVDSCLAAFLSRQFLGKENAIAIISNSESLKNKDFQIAKDFCHKNDIIFEVIHTKELQNPNYFSNPQNRCYFCKNELYYKLKDLVEKKYAGFKIINGNNYTDLGDYRPGLSAASEHKIYSPFIICKVTKSNIRELAKRFNLSVWDKPASPCLSSRVPYGEEITAQKLKRIEIAELILNNYGFHEVRVRSYGDIAKIEVPSKNINKLKKVLNSVSIELIESGFSKCVLDEEGLISGKLNRVLK